MSEPVACRNCIAYTTFDLDTNLATRRAHFGLACRQFNDTVNSEIQTSSAIIQLPELQDRSLNKRFSKLTLDRIRAKGR
ncbi:hypothetical protein ATO3_05015 [Marinibacterium profundimaris]|uniref:Uncharacterized protein n=1 Tax=Marinibacterium profundimaris TaxID=1679460 RepID=A0A225NMR9_9RHOB|nr:hypothetical protein ATO3_05015 [Marinibacterium profundimaris]